MCSGLTCVGFFALAVVIGFSGLIYALLRYRMKFLAENLRLTPDQVWKGVSERSTRLGLAKTDLLFGIHQDKKGSLRYTIIKNSEGTIIGAIDQGYGDRDTIITIGEEKYLIDFPLTWRTMAELKNGDGKVLATFKMIPFTLSKHFFQIPDIGELKSKGQNFSFKFPIDYILNGRAVGLAQEISNRPVGSIVVFPSNYPLSMRIFILAMRSRAPQPSYPHNHFAP